MDPFTGLHVTASGLLALGGVLKVARPVPAARALHALNLPAPSALVRLVGAGEVAVAIAALVWGGPLAFGLQTLCYLGFVAAALAFWRHGGLASCGCFGEIESPPGPIHVVVTVAGALISARAALVAAAAPVDHLPSVAAGLAVLVLVYLLLVDLPRLGAARRLHRVASGAAR